jgi:hypothetical protein
MLEGIEFSRVDVDETHIRILERGLRCGREIGVACADADDQIGVTRDAVGRQRAGRANRTQVLRMVVRQGSFARLRLADWDAG